MEIVQTKENVHKVMAKAYNEADKGNVSAEYLIDFYEWLVEGVNDLPTELAEALED